MDDCTRTRRRAADRLDGHDPGGHGGAVPADGLARRGHAYPRAARRDAAAHDAPGRGRQPRALARHQSKVARGVCARALGPNTVLVLVQDMVLLVAHGAAIACLVLGALTKDWCLVHPACRWSWKR